MNQILRIHIYTAIKAVKSFVKICYFLTLFGSVLASVEEGEPIFLVLIFFTPLFWIVNRLLQSFADRIYPMGAVRDARIKSNDFKEAIQKSSKDRIKHQAERAMQKNISDLAEKTKAALNKRSSHVTPAALVNARHRIDQLASHGDIESLILFYGMLTETSNNSLNTKLVSFLGVKENL